MAAIGVVRYECCSNDPDTDGDNLSAYVDSKDDSAFILVACSPEAVTTTTVLLNESQVSALVAQMQSWLRSRGMV